jgi:hypothetical protein
MAEEMMPCEAGSRFVPVDFSKGTPPILAQRPTDLVAKVAARKKFLVSIIPFITNILQKVGTRTFYSQGNSNTHTMWELRDFGEFDFFGEFEKSQWGGNEIKIWHPARGCIVMHITFQTDHTDCKVIVFNNDPTWQQILEQTIANKDQLILERNQRIELERERQEAERLQAIANRSLEDEARRLKIID